jgi:hypothetical protein
MLGGQQDGMTIGVGEKKVSRLGKICKVNKDLSVIKKVHPAGVILTTHQLTVGGSFH